MTDEGTIDAAAGPTGDPPPKPDAARIIGRVLLVLGLILMLYVVIVIGRALG